MLCQDKQDILMATEKQATRKKLLLTSMIS